MKKFINELGNEISIDVSEQVINGVDGILVTIEGPISKSENHITRVEAKVLLEQLNEVLK